MSEEFTGYTVSFRPGGSGYDSPLVVVRANSLSELLEKLNTDNDDAENLADAVGDFHEMLQDGFRGEGERTARESSPSVAIPITTTTNSPIWTSVPPSAGPLSPNPDGTYPPCPHGTTPRKPWTSPRNGRKYLFCKLAKGTPGACDSVVVP